MKTESKKDIYSTITDRITEKLIAGTVPWRKPWNSNSANLGDNQNIMSGKAYRGINAVSTYVSGYNSNKWASFKQWSDVGGKVRKGEKSTPVLYWASGVEEQSDGSERKWGCAKYSCIFNMDQVDNVDSLKAIDAKNMPATKTEFERIEACEKILDRFFERDKKLTLRNGGNRAYYMPARDAVQMPERQDFSRPTDYYAVLFHELSHATGHESRLARKTVTGSHGFGTHEYSKEELIAELGSAFLCGVAGIDTAILDQSAAYIQSWLRVLRHGDPKILVQSASAAQKAADLILGKPVQS